MDTDRSELTRRAISGDAAAFGELYEEMSGELYRYALYVLGSCEQAEDAVQDAVCAAFAGISGLKNESSFKPWVFKILSNVCKKHISELCRTRNSSSIDDDESVVPPLSTDFDVHLSTELSSALGCLSLEEKNIVLLSAVAGFTSVEISESTGIPGATVRSKLARALKKLRVCLS